MTKHDIPRMEGPILPGIARRPRACADPGSSAGLIELSDSELDAVSGGIGPPTKNLICGTFASTLKSSSTKLECCLAVEARRSGNHRVVLRHVVQIQP